MYNFLGFKLTRDEFITLIVIIVVLGVVFLAIIFHIIGSHPKIRNLKQAAASPQLWMVIGMLVVTLIVVGYGGFLLMTRTRPEDRMLTMALWGASIVLLWGAYMAFFHRGLVTETAYITLIFIAVHVSLTYHLAFIDRLAMILYLVGAVWYVYIALILFETANINEGVNINVPAPIPTPTPPIETPEELFPDDC